jgi:hypothetical protein
MAAATATRTNGLTTTIPIIAIRCIAIPPFHLAACQSTLLIDKFVPTIGALNLAVRADALDTLRRQCRLRLGNEIRQSLAYFGIREDPLAVLADEGPGGHARLWLPVKAVRIHKVRVPFSCELVERILLLTAILWAQLPQGQLQS